MTSLVVVFAALAGAAGGAQAGGPFAKTQAPGWYRMQLGDFEITAISDGTAPLPMENLLTGAPKEKIVAGLTAAFLAPPFETSVNVFLVNTGTKLVLIDTGAGGLFGPTLGKLMANLKSAGYKPEQIDEIYITHMHGDHVGNLVAGGKIAFPKAIVRAGKADADFWLSPDTLAKAPDAMKDMVKGAQTSLNPYVKAGKFKAIEGAGELVPGISAQPAPGHTPGHTLYVVESKGQKLVVVGDILHVAAIQFPDPNVTIQFDNDSKAALAERLKDLADAAKGGYYLAFAHVPFPGVGHLAKDGAGYRWYPVNYSNSAPAKK